jgi:hypothetical protein
MFNFNKLFTISFFSQKVSVSYAEIFKIYLLNYFIIYFFNYLFYLKKFSFNYNLSSNIFYLTSILFLIKKIVHISVLNLRLKGKLYFILFLPKFFGMEQALFQLFVLSIIYLKNFHINLKLFIIK